ncbi:MAG: hypothetical protein IJ193_04655 [Bacilli bacterium]|nr:hypothetical protein [Bacilli bacterium]
MDDLSSKLKQLDIEDYIWLIYIGIIILSWYSNGLERNYFLTNDTNSKNQYLKIMQIIFSILIVVYLYFLKDSVDSIRNLKETDSMKKKQLVYLSFIASLFIAISGFIFLYLSFVDDEFAVELAFN